VTIVDILGRQVKTLANFYQTAGKYKLHWSGNNNDNKAVSSGVYIVLLIVGEKTMSQKIVLTR
jgi:hypothetical protein